MVRYDPYSENILKILSHNYINIGVKCKYSLNLYELFFEPVDYHHRFLLVALRNGNKKQKYLGKIFSDFF